MFKKFTTLFLAVIIFTTASSVSIFGQAKLTDDNQTVSQNTEAENEKLRESFLKKQEKANYDAKDNLATHQKQKAQKSMFSTKTKILIGVGVAVAVVAVILVARDGFKEAANPF